MDNSLYTSGGSTDAQQKLASFWNTVNEEINTVQDFKTQELPLARIKKIMKMDEEVKMISAEAPILFAKAAEIFINELSLRAWIHTEDNKRRTLQRNDIAMAVAKYDQFDFLIDIVPRDELKPQKRQESEVRNPTNDQVQYYFQLANPATSTSSTSSAQNTTPQQSGQAHQIQPTQVMQAVGNQQGNPSNSAPQNNARPTTSAADTSSNNANSAATNNSGSSNSQQLYNMTALRFNGQLPSYNRPTIDNNQYSYQNQLSYLQPQVYNSNQTSYQGNNSQNRSATQD